MSLRKGFLFKLTAHFHTGGPKRGSRSLLAWHDDPMEDDSTKVPRLTLDQACVAAYEFIHQFCERDELNPKPMFFLLHWMRLERSRESSEPTMWFDLINSVAKNTRMSNEDLLSESVSQPRLDIRCSSNRGNSTMRLRMGATEVLSGADA